MTIAEVLEILERVPEGKRDLPLWVHDWRDNTHYEIGSVNPYDTNTPVGEIDTEYNWLAINIDTTGA